jgi:hypothetical protein
VEGLEPSLLESVPEQELGDEHAFGVKGFGMLTGADGFEVAANQFSIL